VQAGPDTQADGGAVSDGRLDGLAAVEAGVPKPEADPSDLASRRRHQDSVSADNSPIINPFDPDRIRIGTNYGDLAAGRSADLTFPVWARPPKAA
jgi:hypothetical protein